MNQPVLSSRRHLILGVFTLAILVFGFGGWAVLAQLSGAVVAAGQVEVDQNRQVVQHPDGGVVAEIAVDEGDLVAAGDILIRLDARFLRSELAIIESQLFELMARRGRLEAERDEAEEIDFDPELAAAAQERPEVLELMDGQERLLRARSETMSREIEQLNKRKSQIATQVQGIEAQQASISRQLELAREQLEKQRNLLASGIAPEDRVIELQRQEVQLEGTMGELTARRGEAEERITEIDIEILKLSNARREEAITRLRDLQFRELELAEQRRSLLERLSRLDIRAPVSGVVYGMTVFAPRSVIRPADPLMYLIPQDRPLIVAVQVEPTDVDEVFTGQNVIVRFSSFDSRSTPELIGEVVQLSADAFMDEAAGRAFYRAEIVLPEEELEKLPAGLALIPGMPVEAFLKTTDRTPIAYLLKPLTDYFAKAFRET